MLDGLMDDGWMDGWMNEWMNEFSPMMQQGAIGFSYCQSKSKAAKRGMSNKWTCIVSRFLFLNSEKNHAVI